MYFGAKLTVLLIEGEYTSEQNFCRSVEQYIRFYNEVRPHQTLKYQTLQAFEEKYYASFIENRCSDSVME